MRALLLSLLLASCCAAQLPRLHTAEEYSQVLGALTDPRKLATLEGERATLLKESLLRNLDIPGKLGCLEVAGIGKLRTGNAPTIIRGPYTPSHGVA